MKTDAIKQLNELNRKFYQRVALHFDSSRKFYWHGWSRLLPHLTECSKGKKSFKVLDIGCGNARFASFLCDTLTTSSIEYYGIDFNERLLAAAETRLSRLPLSSSLHQIDIVEALMQKGALVEESSFDLIVIFGVLHHIPSYQLRKQLLIDTTALLADEGLLCCTLWRFLDQEKTDARSRSPEELALQDDDLEPHDYFVSWERGVKATRYCHFTPDYEEARLVTACELPLIDNFESDGKEGNGNKYLVFKKLL